MMTAGRASEDGGMMTPRLEIEYCRQCRWLLRAAWLAQELLTTFDKELGDDAPASRAAPHHRGEAGTR